MSWVQPFPTANTRISQSVAQIQANWLFIQNNINTDHYFNSGAPTEGHHKFVHLPTQGADPAVILTGVVYQKLNAVGNPRLYYRNTLSGPSQLATAYNTTTVVPGAGNTIIMSFLGTPRVHGIVTVVNYAAQATRACVFLTFDGVGAATNPIAVGGLITACFAAGTDLVVTTTGACTLNAQFIKIEE